MLTLSTMTRSPTALDAAHPAQATPLDALRAPLQRALLGWFDAERVALPWRERRTPYAVLVSEFMLQQTQRDRVIPKYLSFMERFPNLTALAAASPADVIRAWAGLGYNSRALRLHQLACRLAAAGEEIPADLDRLRPLPGVGEYTARAVASFGHGVGVACVDTNVRRVLGRIVRGEQQPAPRPKVDLALAEALVPAARAADWNAALMDLGALVCTAQSPRCDRCPATSLCAARPAFAPRSAALARTVAEGRGRYAAGRQPREPFRSTDRYLRGRIVATLRDLADGASLDLDALALAATGMALPPQSERVALLVERLISEGMIEATAEDGGVRLYRLPGATG
jgi:A/G-specific adenine glycosylase